MPFSVSPSVSIREIDLTNVVPALSTSIGAIAGAFAWGPAQEIVTVDSEKTLISRFGKPDDNTFKYFFPAAQYLGYSNTLRVVRTENAGMVNATNSGTGVLVRNMDHFEGRVFTTGQEFIAKYPGEMGNSIAVYVVTSREAFYSPEFTEPGYASLFDFPPGTTDFAEARNVRDDEMHIVIVDSRGAWTGIAGSVLETFQGLSQASGSKKSDGSNNFYKDVINISSKYVWAANTDVSLPSVGKSVSDATLPTDSEGVYFVTLDSVMGYSLNGGKSGTSAEPTIGELKKAYDLFADTSFVDINILIGTSIDNVEDKNLANYLIGEADRRKDIVACVSPSPSRTINTINAANNVISWARDIISSSYGILDSTALYIYDKYNDKYRWIPACGTVAGLCAHTDKVADPWFSPAGFNRGQLRGIVKVAFNPTKTDRDEIYKNRVNPIVSFPGQGTVLYGDKTAQAKPSAFDRINVRRLFITLQKSISTAAKYQLFELNDEFTRAQFLNMVNPYLREVKGRRGITDFYVVCDETNNTSEIVDTNRFVADIYIKPTRSINFILLNFVAVRTGVEFNEVIGASAE
jgi:hypothetical protein